MTKGRWLVVVLALILATLATAGVFLGHSTRVQEPPMTCGPMVAVVVSKVDIPARTDLNTLIKGDQFKIIQVPTECVVVDGVVTSVHQLRDGYNSVAILAGELIRAAWIKGV